MTSLGKWMSFAAVMSSLVVAAIDATPWVAVGMSVTHTPAQTRLALLTPRFLPRSGGIWRQSELLGAHAPARWPAFRHGVRHGLDCRVFSLVSGLPSPASASGIPLCSAGSPVLCRCTTPRCRA